MITTIKTFYIDFGAPDELHQYTNRISFMRNLRYFRNNWPGLTLNIAVSIYNYATGKIEFYKTKTIEL